MDVKVMHGQNQPAGREIFSYKLTDAWFAPITRVSIYDLGDGGTLRAKCNDVSKKTVKKVLSEAVMVQIRSAISSHSRVFDDDEEINTPGILDGNINDYHLEIDEAFSTDIMAFNFGAYFNDAKRRDSITLRTRELIVLHQEVADILAETGLNRKYMQHGFEQTDSEK